jgi:hypothetical protein
MPFIQELMQYRDDLFIVICALGVYTVATLNNKLVTIDYNVVNDDHNIC